MKRLLQSVMSLCVVSMLALVCAPAPQPEAEVAPQPTFDQTAEETAIRKIFDEFPKHYSEHDTQALIPYFDEKVEFFGDHWENHEDAQKGYEKIFERQKNIQGRVDEVSIVFVTPEVALAQPRGEYTGLVDADGKPAEQSKFVAAVVLVKKKGGWLIRAMYEKPVEE